jgi:hypothetical protein
MNKASGRPADSPSKTLTRRTAIQETRAGAPFFQRRSPAFQRSKLRHSGRVELTELQMRPRKMSPQPRG